MTESLGARIGRLRDERGLSRAEFARKVGVSNQAATQWELHDSQPHMKHLRKIAAVLGVTLDELSPVVEIEQPQGHSAWAVFLGSPEGQSMTKEEQAILGSIDWQGREPTPQALAALLAVVRMTPPAATNQ